MKTVFYSMAMLLCSAMSALADNSELGIRATIIQCGAQSELHYACVRDDRCCALRDLFWDGAGEVSKVPVIDDSENETDFMSEYVRSVFLEAQ